MLEYKKFFRVNISFDGDYPLKAEECHNDSFNQFDTKEQAEAYIIKFISEVHRLRDLLEKNISSGIYTIDTVSFYTILGKEKYQSKELDIFGVFRKERFIRGRVFLSIQEVYGILHK